MNIASLANSSKQFAIARLKGQSKWFFSQDLLLISLLVICLGLGGVFWNFYLFEGEKEAFESELSSLEMTLKRIETDNENKKLFEKDLFSSDPRYLQYAIESHLPFNNEYLLFEDILSFSAFKGFKALKKRLDLLGDGKNQFRMSLVQKGIVAPLHESILSMKGPVGINTSDMKLILARVEGRQIEEHLPLDGRPQLYFKKFHLDRSHDRDSREEYQVYFEVLKRDRN